MKTFVFIHYIPYYIYLYNQELNINPIQRQISCVTSYYPHDRFSFGTMAYDTP